jgi:hypothetical protein
MSFTRSDLDLLTEIEKAINDRRIELAQHLTAGKAADFADYRYRAGQIKALDDILLWAKDANRRVLGLPEKAD